MLIVTDAEVELSAAEQIAEQPGVTGVWRVPAV
jgi:hypothetical protein